MNHIFFQLLLTAVDGSSRLLSSHICMLDSWIFGENYNLICGKPEWRTALLQQILKLQLRTDQRSCFCNEHNLKDWWLITKQQLSRCPGQNRSNFLKIAQNSLSMFGKNDILVFRYKSFLQAQFN